LRIGDKRVMAAIVRDGRWRTAVVCRALSIRFPLRVSCAAFLLSGFKRDGRRILLFSRKMLCRVAIFVSLPAMAVANVADLPRTSESFTIDGVLDEAMWNEAVRVDLAWETDPGENIEAHVATRAFLIEDGENLYVAFEASDPEPAAIRAFLRDRDSAWGDDHVGIILDTYNDQRRSFEFFANPLGVQMDKIHDDTGAGDFGGDWDAIWDSAGQITDAGFVVEMQIPLSQLRFPDVPGIKTWGYDLRRVYPRSRTYTFSSNARDRNRGCYLCQIGKLQGLESSRPSRDIEVVPTLTAAWNAATEEPGFVPLDSSAPEVNAGLSMRWGISPDLTANLTINPDFSQIEADVAQLDVNNRFTLFFPEKRPFFLEGSSYFATPIDAVFTRTISAPEVGAKLTGKRGRHTFGAITARDEVTNLLFPGLYSSETETVEASNTVFVGRYSLGLADTSSVGALVTMRQGDDYHNYVGGVDGRWRFDDQHTLSFQHLESTTAYPFELALEYAQPTDEFDGHATTFEYEFDSRNWSADLAIHDYSAGFRADSGFVRKVGGRQYESRIGYLFYGDVDTWWTRIRVNLHHDRLEQEDGLLAQRDTRLRAGVGGPWQSWAQVHLVDSQERHEGVLYDKRRASLYTELVPAAGLELMFLVSLGDTIDYANDRAGKSQWFEQSTSWNVSRSLLFRLRSTFSRLETLSEEEVYDAALIDSRLTWQFNVRSFLRLTLQYRDVSRNPSLYIEEVDARSKDVGRQLLYSYKLNPQTVFYLGYTDSYIDNDDVDDLTAEDRTWFMKVGYAWTP
jgi:hypothetical protein